MPSEVAERLPELTWFSISGSVEGGISGVAQADARDEDAANALRDVMRGFVALAKLQAGNRPEFRAVAESLTLGGTGKRVSLSFSIPNEVLDTFGAPRQPAAH